MTEFGYFETDPTGRYGRFKEVLGKGAMKVVYKAFDEVLGMEVAWNLVNLNNLFRSPDELQRLYSEVHLLRTLNHESIIHSYTSWISVEKRTFNFITEMFTSGTLREYRQKYKRVDMRAVKRWARQILNGLAYLHGHDPPVIHRDLKCDNIFVNGHLAQVKIGDLGLAAILRGSQAHSVIGTPEFMAPELYEEEYNELVDIYSFGMCVLEMLTSEYPYSECINPAQIYKKVTSGKLPEAFQRIHNLEARKFIGKCLEKASVRLSAKELLQDPFLAFDDAELFPAPNRGVHNHKKTLDDAAAADDDDSDDDDDDDDNDDNASKSSNDLPPVVQLGNPSKSTDMTITGKLNPEDDTIFLKVQIADKNGSVRNIYFPFDIQNDTPIDVATEMVKELDILDWQPIQIADMIEKEISVLIPQWKEEDLPQEQPHHTFSFEDDDEDEGLHHPFHSFSSCSSSQSSLHGMLPFCEAQFYHEAYNHHSRDWLQGELFHDDETSSQSSMHSVKYSNVNYNYHNEHDCDLSPRRTEHLESPKTQKSTRFYPEERPRNGHNMSPKCNPVNDIKIKNHHQLMRLQSRLDVRSQLLHRSLMEEMNKHRLFRTVGAVENIGYQAPCEVSRNKSLACSTSRCSVRASRNGKNS